MSGKSSYLGSAIALSLVPTRQRGAGATDGAGVDVKAFSGRAIALLDVTHESGTTPTLAVKLQESDTQTGTYTDIVGAAFATVGATSGTQKLPVDLTASKRWVRATGVEAGGTPVYAWGVQLVASLQQEGALLENAWEGDELGLDEELERTLLRIHTFGTAPELERGTTGSTTSAVPPSLVLTTGVGANRIREVRIEGLNAFDIPFEAPDGSDFFQFVNEIAAHIGPYAPPVGTGLRTNTMFAGIEFGTMLSNAPFPAAPANCVCQLRFNYGTEKWELVSAPGGGVETAAIVELTGITSHVEGGASRVRLIFDPVTPQIVAMVNGVVGARITNLAKLPKWNEFAGSNLVFGAFVTSGTHASGNTSAWFSAVHCKTYDLWVADRAAPFWY